MQLQPNFHFLEVAYPYVARRLLTDEDPALRERLFQVRSVCRFQKAVLPIVYLRQEQRASDGLVRFCDKYKFHSMTLTDTRAGT